LNDYRKPKWWKRSVKSYWFLFVLMPFIAVLAVFGVLIYLGLEGLGTLLTYIGVTTIAVATSYFLRKNSSPRLWRTIWVLGGIGVIGFPISVVLAILLTKALSPIAGWPPPLFLSIAIAIIIGGLLGDQIGKRRGYRPLG
jgi:membrane protease YdiL (CAAX protease family)